MIIAEIQISIQRSSSGLLTTLGVSFCLSLDTKEAKTKTHPAVISARKRKKSSQKKDATRKGDWNSLTGRKLSPLQMPSCLILTVVQLVNMCVIVFCSSVVPSSPFFLVFNTHPMPISQYLIEQAENLKSLWQHIIGLYCAQLVFKTKTKIRIFFWPHPLHHCFAVQIIGCWQTNTMDVSKQIQEIWCHHNGNKSFQDFQS